MPARPHQAVMAEPGEERDQESAGGEADESLPRRFRASLTGQLTFRRRVGRVEAGDLPLRDGRDGPPAWEQLARPGRPIELEVGPGKGRFLLAAAAARPEVAFLGVEAAPPYAFFTAGRIKRAGLDNALVVIDDATLFLSEAVPPGALQAVHVYFPDPWPKRRHRKRRFFRPQTLPLLHRVLAPAGLLLIATDAAAYFAEILTLLERSPLFGRTLELEAPGALPPEHAFGPTHFEEKYRVEGRPIHRCAWRRTGFPCNLPPEG